MSKTVLITGASSGIGKAEDQVFATMISNWILGETGKRSKL